MRGLLSLLFSVLLLLGACRSEPAPLDMILEADGISYAGVAVVDITPVITETFTDLNGNSDFNRSVSLLSDRDGDHYEDTVSPSWDFAPELQRAQAAISSRWPSDE
jgi:hypothetical protein